MQIHFCPLGLYEIIQCSLRYAHLIFLSSSSADYDLPLYLSWFIQHTLCFTYRGFLNLSNVHHVLSTCALLAHPIQKYKILMWRCLWALQYRPEIYPVCVIFSSFNIDYTTGLVSLGHNDLLKLGWAKNFVCFALLSVYFCRKYLQCKLFTKGIHITLHTYPNSVN